MGIPHRDLDIGKSAGFQARAFFLGLLCAVAQLVIFRELMSSLYGNELVFIGLMAAWSLGIAGGSFIPLRKVDSSLLFLIGIIVLALTVMSIRYLRLWMGIPPGQMLDLGVMLTVAFVVTLPVCLVWGALYSVLARDHGARVYGIESLGFAAGGVLMCLFWMSPLNGISPAERAPQWPGYAVVAATETGYASAVVVERGGEKSLFENGIHVATSHDALTAEEMVHYPLLAADQPKMVLLIGGMASGALGELLKYSGVAVDCVERDAKALQDIRANFPDPTGSFHDPRVRLLLDDGRRVVRRAHNRGEYDVIIIAGGEPSSILANRYWTVEFFEEARLALKPEGILSVSLTASENYVNDEGRRALASVRDTLARAFTDVKVIPGGRYIFLASQREGGIVLNAGLLTSRFNGYGLQTRYVRPYEISLRLESSRLRKAEDLLRGSGVMNTDSQPAGFVSFLAYVSTQTNSVFPFVLDIVRRYSWALWLLPVGVFLISRRRSAAPFVTVCAAGFTQMSLQAGVVMMFQAVYGYVYTVLGVLTALFMLGMAGGALRPPGKIVRAQWFGAWLAAVAGLGMTVAADGALGEEGVFFALILFWSGWCGGRQFASALPLTGPRARWLYGADVLGAAAGALLCGIFLIPLWGVPTVFLFCAALQAAVALAGRSQPASSSA